MRVAPHFMIGTAILWFTFILSFGAPAGAQSPPPTQLEDLEMGTTERAPAADADSALLAAFTKEYDASMATPRPVFAKYLPLLGPAPLLDFLEERYPACHAQSHELGKALFSAAGDLNQALRDCGRRCTSGCMHGAVGEAFGNATPEMVTGRMNTFCAEGEMARLHKPGNCAHALGHAFMFVNGGDVSTSIDHCLGFAGEAMQYFCATGVYMEKLLTGPTAATADPTLHHPCDEEKLFPAACYRYKAAGLLKVFGDHRKLGAECMRLDGFQRSGCFHGLGNAVAFAIFEKPEVLARACDTGGVADRTLCIEGVIEKLADFDEPLALRACDSLDGEFRQVCRDAAGWKMYNLDKPTLALYYDGGAVAARRESVAKSAPDPKPHHHH